MVPSEFRGRYIQSELGEDNAGLAKSSNPDMVAMAADAMHLPCKSASLQTVIAMDLVDVVGAPSELAAEV